jgi:hypothetical protein
MKTKTLPFKHSVNRSLVRLALLLISLACLAFSPEALAVCKEGCLTDGNTVLGNDALLNNSGSENTATGDGALHDNTTGYVNTAVGNAALYFNRSGYSNVAVGDGALNQNTSGTNNTAVGLDALARNNGGYNVAVGYGALSEVRSGSGNVALGSLAGGAFGGIGDNNIEIGSNVYGVAGESNTIRIGNGQNATTFIAGIRGATVPTGVPVIVDGSGHLGTTTSSARYKDNVQPMDKASEAILSLKPVTFRYKKELDPDGIPQFGLVAEQVETVNPDLVARDEHGKAYTVRYEAVNAMLLNEFLKEHRKVEKLEATVEGLAVTVKEQAAQIQKANAQLEASKPTPQVVKNP